MSSLFDIIKKIEEKREISGANPPPFSVEEGIEPRRHSDKGKRTIFLAILACVVAIVLAAALIWGWRGSSVVSFEEAGSHQSVKRAGAGEGEFLPGPGAADAMGPGSQGRSSSRTKEKIAGKRALAGQETRGLISEVEKAEKGISRPPMVLSKLHLAYDGKALPRSDSSARAVTTAASSVTAKPGEGTTQKGSNGTEVSHRLVQAEKRSKGEELGALGEIMEPVEGGAIFGSGGGQKREENVARRYGAMLQENEVARADRIRVEVVRDPFSSNRWRRMLESAESYRRAGDLNSALSLYKKLWGETHNPLVGNNYGAILIVLKRFSDAKKVLTDALRYAPKDQDLLFNLSVAKAKLEGKDGRKK